MTGNLSRADPGRERDESTAEELTSGRSAATPFVLLGSVALTIWAAAGVAVLVALAVWWLV